MDGSRKLTSVFYVEAGKAWFYNAGISSPMLLEFPPDVFSNMEVVDRKKMEALIQSFLESYKIAPSSLVIILSPNVTFEKDLSSGATEAPEIQKFLDFVPFEEPVHKEFDFSGKKKIVAANKELLDVLEKSFRLRQFNVNGAYPLSFFQILIPSLKESLNFEAILTKLDDLKDYNFLKTSGIINKLPAEGAQKNKRLYVLLAVFGVLVLALVIIAYSTFSQAPSSPTPQKTLPAPSLQRMEASPPASPSAAIPSDQINP